MRPSSYSSSSGGSSQNVSQHVRNYYNLLRDGGLDLPTFESVQFGSSKKKSSFEKMKSLHVKDAMQMRRHIEKEVIRKTKKDIENFCFAIQSMIEDEKFFALCLLPFET